MKQRHSFLAIILSLFSTIALGAPVVFSSTPSFGEVNVGESKVITINVKNNSKQQVRIAEYWFQNTEAFTVVGGTCRFNEYVLKSRKSCSVQIQFKPTYAGNFSDVLTIGYYLGSGWTWAESTVSMSGTGKVVVVEPDPTPAPEPDPTPAPEPDPTPAPTPSAFLRVEGNKILNSLNQQVVLRGVNIADPQHLDTKTWERPGVNARSIASLATDTYYAKVVRIPILPGNPSYPNEGWFSTTNGGEKYFNNHVLPLVNELTSKGIYAIIDLHYVSNYDTLYSKVHEFWNYMAPKFKDNPYVLYEIFNEPILPDNWSTWKNTIAQPITNLIRSHAPNNLILVGGPYWSSHMSGAATDPVVGNNIVYVAHIYSNQGPTSWARNYGILPDVAPMFVTEWGYENGGTEGGTYVWGQEFVNWMNSKNISWTAWCFDNLWGPRMFDKDWNLLTGDNYMGGHVRDLLIDNARLLP